MSRSHILGEVELSCGAGGADTALRFVAKRINVFVGPNNAGKSLMLRELSGIEPRQEYGRGHRWGGTLPGKLVSAVAYGQDAAELVAKHVTSQVLKPNNEVHEALSRLSWPELISTLKQREAKARDFRRQLTDVLRAHLEQVPQIAPLVPMLDVIHQQDVEPALVTLSTLLLGQQSPDTARALLLQAIEGAKSVLDLPGLDLEGIEELAQLRPEELLSAFAVKISKLLPRWVQPPAPAEVAASERLLRQIERLISLAPWVFKYAEWLRLQMELEGRYGHHAWGRGSRPDEFRDVTLYLDGLARLATTEPSQLRPHDPQIRDSVVSTLLDNPSLRSKLRALVFDAIERWLVVDMVTEAPTVQFRLSSQEPADNIENRRDAASDAFLKAAQPLHERSDGIHAYIGILAAILTSNAKLIFIDEPEAFLHPTLARILGRQLTVLARERDLQVFIATHSPELLAGCVAGDPDATVVRLSYQQQQGRAWLLNPESLRGFTFDPRLRSAAALGGLFSQAVVICEGDSDRAFYQEVFERLIEAPTEPRLPRRAEGWMFINAQNWQTERLFLAPLRAMGVPAVAIVDRDVLFAKEKGLTELLRDAGAPEADIRGWKQRLSVLRPHGAEDAEAVMAIIAALKPFGIFVVPVGAVESWLTKDVPATPKNTWSVRAFTWMGHDPNAQDYRWPVANGVWTFMLEIAAWVNDPARWGMSAPSHKTA